MFTTGKLNNSCDDFIQISDCDMVLVYLGKGVFHGTKEKPFLHRSEPVIFQALHRSHKGR